MKKNKRRIFIITGLSGAGKSQALKIFGDFGFYCVDNLPLALFKNFISYLSKTGHEDVALGIDMREGNRLKDLPDVIKATKSYDIKVIFLDASDECLISRFSETKHRHPIHKKLAAAIAHERKALGGIHSMADKVIDTSDLKLGELKEKLSELLGSTRSGDMQISVASFGFKNGIPLDADLVYDVRFLPNPFYIDELKVKTGNDKEVYDYVMSFEDAGSFLEKLEDMLEFLVPNYVKEGKYRLVIGIGCTGGKHRSVTLANALYDKMKNKGNYGLTLVHRDINGVK